MSKFSESTLARFAKERDKYPPEQAQSAVIACLSIVQQEQGWVSQESEAAVAEYLGMPAIAVHEVTTFYNMFNQKPVAKYKLSVCTNLPCVLRSGLDAHDYICKKLDVHNGNSANGLFTVQKSECLGSCADAPVLLVNDRSMCSFMEPARIDEMIEALTKQAEQGDKA